MHICTYLIASQLQDEADNSEVHSDNSAALETEEIAQMLTLPGV